MLEPKGAFSKIVAEEHARKLFRDYSDSSNKENQQTMSEEKFVEIVGKVIYSTKDLVEEK
ncbi:MAG: hypothetical protein HQ534_10725 [Armatimonadetes bacterium]|nr:hypothetical protein [Armatimonadota bacterium]